MRIMYLAGPIGECRDAQAHSDLIHRAWEASEIEGKLLALGWACINPYSSVHCRANFALPYEDWLLSGNERVKACAAICMLPGWQDSNGCRIELGIARKHGLDCYYWQDGQLLVLPGDYGELAERLKAPAC